MRRATKVIGLCVCVTWMTVVDAWAQQPVGLQAFRPLLAALFEADQQQHQRFELLGVGLDVPPVDGTADKSAVQVLLDGLPPGGGSRSVLATYLSAVESAEAAPYVLSEEDAADLRASQRALLRQPTFWDRLLSRDREPSASKKMASYESHAALVAAAEEAFAASPTPQHRQKLEAAKRNWALYGHRAEIESALTRYHTITGADPALWLRNLRSVALDMEAVMAASPTQALRTFAEVESWVAGPGWTKVVSSDATRSIDCEFKRIGLRRHWLDPDFFQSREWRWQAGAPVGDTLISSGSAGGAPGDAGQMPFVPDALLLARNCTASSGGVRVAMTAAQVVGYFATPTPRSPNPDDTLWQVAPRPEPRTEVPLGILHGFSFGEGGVNNKRGQVGPMLYFSGRLSSRYSIIIAPGLALHLRGVGAVIGVGARVFDAAPLRVIGGVRIGSSGERFRAFVGAGIDFSLPGPRPPSQ